MRTLEDTLAEKTKGPVFKAENETLEPEFAIIQAMIDARKKSGITQKLETGGANPSLKTMPRLASGMGMKLKVEFLPVKYKQQAIME
jgi:hypothetical protein